MNMTYRSAALLAFLFLFGLTYSQEYIHGDEGMVYPNVTPAIEASRATPPPPPDTVSLPMFDDFSYDSLFVRMGGIWDVDPTANHLPGVSIAKGILPPTKGVAIFDGATRLGKKYKNVLESGWGDSLVSNVVDLSSKTVADSLYLSFYLEPGGLGDSPEGTDSFCVFFDTTGNYDWHMVCAIYGDSLIKNDSVPGEALSTERFKPIMIPIDSNLYLHSAFRFKFASYGSLNGEFDVWNLDYVLLDEGRTMSDSVFEDVSVIYHHSPIFEDYSTVPQNVYNAYTSMVGPNVETRNFGATSRTRNLNVELTTPDPLGGNAFTGTISQSGSVTIAGGANSIDSLAAFDDQNFAQAGVMEVKTFLDADGADINAGNDTLKVRYRVDSVYGYDDGVADVAYGLTSAKGFCQRFTLPDTTFDTLDAVWINFVPTLYFNSTTQQSTCMEGQNFKVGIWNDVGGEPDTLIEIFLSGMIINFGNSLNEYVRYNLSPKVRVPQTFYMGIIQNGVASVGIGVDKNFSSSGRIFYQNATFDWTPSALLADASLMIRPEFQNSSSFVSRSPAKTLHQTNLTVYPNPIHSGDFNLRITSSESMHSTDLKLIDLNGKTVWRGELAAGQTQLQAKVPGNVGSGIYMLLANMTFSDGAVENLSRKIMIQR